MVKKAKYFEKLDGDAVRCTLCPHGCRILEGGTGRCGVRKNLAGTLFADGYGRLTSVALDPIEKKPLRLFHPGSRILSVGSYGCNFCCSFCQNYNISQEKPPYREIAPEKLVEIALEARREGNIGLAYTYNEPLTAFEFVLDCCRLAKEEGLLNVIVTNGFINKEPLEELLPFVDAMNIDLKAFTEDYYRRLCGGSLEPVKATIARSAADCHVEVTTLVIPGLNDSEEEIGAVAAFVASVSPEIALHLTRHHPDYKLTDPPSITRERLLSLAEIARRRLSNVFCGNC